MSRKMLARVGMAVLLAAVCLCAAPPASQALTISSISVANGTATFTGDFTGGVTGNTWNLATGIVLAPGDTLVLTQNQLNNTSGFGIGTGVAYNFDTSDFSTGNYSITINGGSAIADLGVLNFGGNDVPDSTVINEANNWTLLGTFTDATGTYELYTGYADTLHSGACNDSGNCLPWDGISTWDGTGGSTAATVFLGHGAGAPVAGYPVSSHCVFADKTCFDAGAILIRAIAVPEPSSLFLLGMGLIGVAAYGRRHLKKNP